ncbi:MAG: hypothetical protein JNM63_13755, partial [Spirochaetia bacterium]|nr:hypothetical protein [Spirochaetia bacterium]
MFLKKIWSAVIRSGVQTEMNPRSARFVQNLNGISVMVGLWLLSLSPFWALYLPATRNIMLAGIAVGVAMT